jgi:hypothetical protein
MRFHHDALGLTIGFFVSAQILPHAGGYITQINQVFKQVNPADAGQL